MRYLLLTFLLLSCSRHDDGGTSLNIKKYLTQRDELCKNYDPSLLNKCDRSTFHLAMSAMCPDMPLPTQYEHPEGKWNRDETWSCYPDESRSETSRDAYMSLVLTEDKEAIARAYAWAEKNNGDTGLPANGVGKISDIMPLMRGYMLTGESDSVAAEALDTIKKTFIGHRGHLVANYLWATARLKGGLTLAGRAYVKELHDQTPNSPYFSCLYHRFSRLDNDQDRTLSLLDKLYAGKINPGWGSDTNSWELHYALTVSCLQGD